MKREMGKRNCLLISIFSMQLGRDGEETKAKLVLGSLPFYTRGFHGAMVVYQNWNTTELRVNGMWKCPPKLQTGSQWLSVQLHGRQRTQLAVDVLFFAATSSHLQLVIHGRQVEFLVTESLLLKKHGETPLYWNICWWKPSNDLLVKFTPCFLVKSPVKSGWNLSAYTSPHCWAHVSQIVAPWFPIFAACIPEDAQLANSQIPYFLSAEHPS